jgi:hypothetical protein
MASREWSEYKDIEEEEEEVSLQYKRPFGSGLKRKQVVFVRASSGSFDTAEQSKPTETSKSVSDIYLSIVLPKETGSDAVSADDTNTAAPGICDICKLPVNGIPDLVGTGTSSTRPHEASIAHQVCITHSHPPSALDRSRMGLGVLQAQGWDPDARTGLGAASQGVKFPIKAKPKHNTLGLGVEVPKGIAGKKKKEKPQILNAKKVRKMVAEDKKRHEKLRHQFYGNPEVEKYLGLG